MLELEGEPPTPVCRVKDFDAEALFGRRDARRMDRCAQLATAAAKLALEDAGGDLGLPHERIGASIGSAHGGIGTLDEAYRTYFERGSDRVSPFMIPLALTNTACAAVARTLQLRGPSSSTCTACAAGADAIGIGALADPLGPRRRDARRRRRLGDLARSCWPATATSARSPRCATAPRAPAGRSTPSATAS